MSDERDTFWNIDEVILFASGKEKLYYHLFIKDTPDEINRIKEDFAKVRNLLGTSKTKAISKIWLVGLATLASFNELDSTLLDEKWIARRNKLSEIEKKQEQIAELQKIRSSLNDEEWEQWCEQTNHNPDEVSEYSIQLPNRSDSIRSFLLELLADGNPLSTTDIRQSMIKAGIIQDSDWNNVRVIANRLGLNKNAPYGHWQLLQE